MVLYLVAFAVTHAGGHFVSSAIINTPDRKISRPRIEMWQRVYLPGLLYEGNPLTRDTYRVLSFQEIRP